jgi:hypothetical protein
MIKKASNKAYFFSNLIELYTEIKIKSVNSEGRGDNKEFIIRKGLVTRGTFIFSFLFSGTFFTFFSFSGSSSTGSSSREDSFFSTVFVLFSGFNPDFSGSGGFETHGDFFLFNLREDSNTRGGVF